ncbi:MAG TPA: hypothetical protein PLX89_21755 [Verrucomicrobiota bacterium]|nr:hypothetical protein [Verrucomicrobiota bacterium]
MNLPRSQQLGVLLGDGSPSPKPLSSPTTWLTRQSLAFLSLFALAGTGSAQSFRVNDDWTRNFRLGMQVAYNVKADFSLDGIIPSTSGDPGLPGIPGLNHFYDDGYVRVDNTSNAGGVTSYWGYQLGTQFEPETGQLVFKNTRAFKVTEQSQAEAGASFGLEAAYGGKIRDWDRIRLGWEFGYGFLPLTLEDNRTLPATFERVVQAFNTAGITLPTAPYSGGPSGIGPVIPDIALERPTEVVHGLLTGSRSLQVSLHSLRLGPTLFWRFQRRWALSGSIGPALGIVTGGYHFNEVFRFTDGTEALNSGQDDGTEVVFGGYATATVLFRVVSDADLYFSAQFLTLGDPEFGGVGRTARLNLGATVMTSIGVSWPF